MNKCLSPGASAPSSVFFRRPAQRLTARRFPGILSTLPGNRRPGLVSRIHRRTTAAERFFRVRFCMASPGFGRAVRGAARLAGPVTGKTNPHGSALPDWSQGERIFKPHHRSLP